MNTWKLDVATGTGVIVFAVFILVFSAHFPPPRGTDFGPALFPRVVAGILLLLGTLVLLQVRRFRVRPADPTADMVPAQTTTSAGMRNVAVTVVAIVVYIAIVDRLGFTPTTLVFLFGLMKMYGLTTVKSVIASCFITGFVFVLFSLLLRVVLP